MLKSVFSFFLSLRHPDFNRGVFILRPSLSADLMLRGLKLQSAAAAAIADGSGGAAAPSYVVRGLQFRGNRFDLRFTVKSESELAVHLKVVAKDGTEDSGAASAAIDFVAQNGQSTFHISVNSHTYIIFRS